MTVASVAGFALVFIVCTWTLSLLGTLVLAHTRARLMRLGPMVERRAAEVVAIAPVVISVVVVAVLVAQSVLGLDHCESHDHHAHLCLVHGAAWMNRTWVVVTLGMVGATLLARAVLLAASYIRGAHSIRTLHALSRPLGQVRIVESERAFCFVDGRTIYASAHVWAALSESERSALVAHETAHVQQGDLRIRAILESFLVLAAPLAGSRIRDIWLAASERLCDARAARATGEPACVASAMVSLCRMQASRPAASFGFTPNANELEDRVRAVLAGGPIGERVATILHRSVLALCLVIVASSIVAAEPLHHAFETLLG